MFKKIISMLLAVSIVSCTAFALGAFSEEDIIIIAPLEPTESIVVGEQPGTSPEYIPPVQVIDPPSSTIETPPADNDWPVIGEQENVPPITEQQTPPPASVVEALSISSPSLLSGVSGIGDTIMWLFRATGAEYIAYKVEYNGSVDFSGTLSGTETSFSLNASRPGTYVLVVTAWRGGESKTARSSEYRVQDQMLGAVGSTEALSVSVSSTEQSYFYGQTMSLSADITGGRAPYTTYLTLSLGGQIVAQGSGSLSYGVERSGQYIATAQVTDANGTTASATRVISCALNNTENMDEIVPAVSLTGNWATDMLQVARTQIGYKESDKNYITDETGRKRGYTRYGDWYDMRYNNDAGSSALLYGDWCAMFISFCADIAQIPTSTLPRHTGTSSWVKSLRDVGAYEEAADYTPSRGDIVFINSDGAKGVNHVGIVLEAIGGVITTIEGNANRGVDVRTYDANGKHVKGYVPIGRLQHPGMSSSPAATIVPPVAAVLPKAETPVTTNATASGSGTPAYVRPQIGPQGEDGQENRQSLQDKAVTVDMALSAAKASGGVLMNTVANDADARTVTNTQDALVEEIIQQALKAKP